MNKHTSNTVRLNITLPKDIVARVKTSPNHSALIAESLRQKFAREDKEQLDATLGQAYANATEEDKQLRNDWDVTSPDGL